MDIFINERSFNNQAQSHNIYTLMRQLADTLQMLHTIGTGAEVVVHSSFGKRELCNSQTVASWLSGKPENDDALGNDDETRIAIQTIRQVLLSAFARGPYLEELLSEHNHACYLQEKDHDNSAIAAAACLNGVVVSLEGNSFYPEGPLQISLSLHNNEFATINVAHFIKVAEARKCRRRYVPNPKHHPDHAKGDHSPMELDRAYDRFTPERELELRHPNSDMPDTECQRLLDGALPGGSQLYALVYGKNGRSVTFYEFQPDNMHGFHGYPVPQTEVPSEVVRALVEHARNKLF